VKTLVGREFAAKVSDSLPIAHEVDGMPVIGRLDAVLGWYGR
jgi:hypothetical protein